VWFFSATSKKQPTPPHHQLTQGGSCPPLAKNTKKNTKFFFVALKGCAAKTSSVWLIISIGRLEATADADGDTGRSSQLDHSKEFDLYFSELYWSSF
jgi:hypothetical protein